MATPKAVLISDIHYNINTLPLADASMRQAIAKANDLGVPLIVAGDLHDSKANIRGECMNAMLATFALAETPVFVLRGNHDALNEKSQEHSLGFLRPLVNMIDWPQFTNEISMGYRSLYLIPYMHNPHVMREYLKTIDDGSTIIMHQGVQGSYSGDYIQDKSALDRFDVEKFRVISGHYHRRQDIKCGRPQRGAVGLWSYIGNPFTLGYGEAEDPQKGFQVLMDDGLLEFVPTNLRKHVIYEVDLSDPNSALRKDHNVNDLIWVKLKGTKEELSTMTKTWIKEQLYIEQDFRLDLIPLETGTKYAEVVENIKQPELLDQLIKSTANVSDEMKERLMILWKDMA